MTYLFAVQLWYTDRPAIDQNNPDSIWWYPTRGRRDSNMLETKRQNNAILSILF